SATVRDQRGGIRRRHRQSSPSGYLQARGFNHHWRLAHWRLSAHLDRLPDFQRRVYSGMRPTHLDSSFIPALNENQMFIQDITAKRDDSTQIHGLHVAKEISFRGMLNSHHKISNRDGPLFLPKNRTG